MRCEVGRWALARANDQFTCAIMVQDVSESAMLRYLKAFAGNSPSSKRLFRQLLARSLYFGCEKAAVCVLRIIKSFTLNWVSTLLLPMRCAQ